MSRIFAGSRIRTLRRDLGLTQSAMAKALGFSTSYLNQLENDHRPLTVTALMQMNSVYGVPAEFFSGAGATRTAASLQQAFATTLNRTADETQLKEFAARFPELAQDVLAMSRLAGPPDPGTGAEDPTRDSPLPVTTAPHEVVRDFFHSCGNYFDDIDRAAEQLSESLPEGRGDREESLRGRLLHRHGIRVVRIPAEPAGRLTPRRELDRTAQVLRLRSDLTRSQAVFEMSMQIAFLEHRELLDDALSDDLLLTPGATTLARFGLAQYFAGAVVLPYERFLTAAEDLRYDIELLGATFGTGFETTAQRLSTLQRRGRTGVPLFLLRTDRAGNISKRQSATSFHFSRNGGSCPRWALHRAFDTPGRIIRQVVGMPDGRTYLWIAQAISHRTGGYTSTPTEHAIGVGCDIEHARRLTYSAGLDLDPRRAVPIGPGCRTCPRPDCLQRAFPPSGSRLAVDEGISPAVPYRHSDAAES